MYWDNGIYLLIDGHCRYWTNAGAGLRTGVIDLDELSALLSDLLYDQWVVGSDSAYKDEARRGPCGGSTPGSGCTSGPDRSVVDDWRRRLYEEGDPVAPGSDARVEVFSASSTSQGTAEHWPLTTISLADAAAATRTSRAEVAAASPEPGPEDIRGAGLFFTGRDAAALRGVPREAGTPAALVTDQEGGPLYDLFLRDATPFEDEHGLLDWFVQSSTPVGTPP